jgi:prepilin-type N-terminal cleavage/methylation domain-containing protein
MARKVAADPGFTLVELAIVLAIIGVAVLIGMPALLNGIRRAEVEGGMRQAAVELRAARLEAIKKSATVYVEADMATDAIVTWRETGVTPGFNPADPGADQELRRLKLPSRLDFWGPADATAEGPDATEPASTPLLTFLPSGSAEDTGAFRFGDGRGNFLEVRVDPPATARITMRKWDGAAFRQQDEGGQRWTWY